MSTAALANATAALADAGCDSPRLDAELLLAEATEVDRFTLLTRGGSPPSAAQTRRFESLVARRARREPVAYILGRRAFRELELAVDPRVLVPRPETELLVEVALALDRGARVLDVGTGSGAVALALKHERPDLELTGGDLSTDALDVARANGERLGLNVAWCRADLLAGAGGPWDGVVANLPYVADAELERLAPEIARHEPRSALAAGAGGLELITRLVAEVARARVPWVALEVGIGQAEVVRECLVAAGYRSTGRTRISPASRASWSPGGPDVRGRGDARALHARHGVAVFPADTVYGLACDPDAADAVQRLYRLKRRGRGKPAAVMFFDRGRALAALPELEPRTRAALARLLPGGLTVLLPNPAGRFPLACGPDPATLGLRVPRLDGELAPLSQVRPPVLQSSANRAGGADPRRLAEVPAEVRRGADLLLDGGELPGTPSTVLDLRRFERDEEWRIVREGAVPAAAIAAAIG